MSEKDDKKPGKRVSKKSKGETQKLLGPDGLLNPFSSMQEQLKKFNPGITSIPDLSPITNASQFKAPFDNPPKREIEMSESDEKIVKEALDYFESNSIYENELLKLFEDWQSNRTKSIKKFLLSLTSVLSLTVFAGINILKVELFNITVVDDYEYLFLIVLFLVIVGLFYYYEINLWRDKRVNDSNLKVFMNALQRSDLYLEDVDTILNEKGITIEQLVEDFEDNSLAIQQKSSPLRGYRLMKFFKNDLEEPFTTDLNIYRFELSGLYFLGLLSTLTILRSMIWVSNPDVDLVLFYVLGIGIIVSFITLLQLRFGE